MVILFKRRLPFTNVHSILEIIYDTSMAFIHIFLKYSARKTPAFGVVFGISVHKLVGLTVVIIVYDFHWNY